MPLSRLAIPTARPAAAAAAWLLAALVAGCSAKEPSATQSAARVNKDEITVHQIGALLAQQPARAEPSPQAERQALERLIDRQLAVDKAVELKLDRDPKVVQAIESARMELLARAYADRLSEGLARPTPTEVRRYYDRHPALFAERKIYALHEFAIEGDGALVGALRAELPSVSSADQVQTLLQARGVKFTSSRAVRAAEQVPLHLLPALSRLGEGQSLLQATPRGAHWTVVTGVQAQPVEEERAARAIEQFLLNEQKRKLLADDLKALRATARVEYLGRFAGQPPADAVAHAATAAEVAASAAAIERQPPVNEAAAANAGTASAGGIDASTISKGLGLK
jgi:EpsD family peptidyl-prolyl cis-trans isomerase